MNVRPSRALVGVSAAAILIAMAPFAAGPISELGLLDQTGQAPLALSHAELPPEVSRADSELEADVFSMIDGGDAAVLTSNSAASGLVDEAFEAPLPGLTAVPTDGPAEARSALGAPATAEASAATAPETTGSLGEAPPPAGDTLQPAQTAPAVARAAGLLADSARGARLSQRRFGGARGARQGRGRPGREAGPRMGGAQGRAAPNLRRT